MLIFNIDPRDGAEGACGVCCCQTAVTKPGEKNKWQLNYAAWSIPIGGKGLSVNTEITVEKKSGATVGTNGVPVISIANPTTPLNTNLVGDLKDYVTDPEAEALTFTRLPLYDPKNGEFTAFNADGTFTYAPNGGFTGYDRFFFQVSDGVNKPRVGEVVIGVGQSAATAARFTKPINVPGETIRLDRAWHTLSFAVEASPALVPGEIYRMSVSQEALDCEFQSYINLSCYDILIQSC